MYCTTKTTDPEDLHLATVVNTIFLTALGRPVSDDDREALVNVLKSGDRTIEVLVEQINDSLEAKARRASLVAIDPEASGFVSQTAYFAGIVEALFQALLRRIPSAQDVAAWSAVLKKRDRLIASIVDELASSEEGKKSYANYHYSDHPTVDYIHVNLHYQQITDVLYRTILGRPANEQARVAFAEWMQKGELSIDAAIEDLLDGKEVQDRIKNALFPDVLEGIYRALKGAPEADEEVKALVRGAVSRRTGDVIRKMLISPETQHFYLRPIIESQLAEFK